VNRPTLLLLCLSLLLLVQVGPASSAPLTTALTTPEAGRGESTASTDIPFDENQDKVRLFIQVIVPQNRRSSNEFTVYPYPVETPAPHPRLSIYLLSTTEKDLKGNLLVLGYTARVKKQLPYINCGYRMNYAYQRSLRRSGLGEPHTLGELYRWQNEMLPFFKYEVLKSNESENARMVRMAATKELFAKERVDIETEALKQGLYPAEVRIGPWDGPGQRGMVYLPKGRWWIVGTHKLLGLTFYWQEAVDLVNDGQVVQLHDGNALLIEGAW
jgi:hypothetical protein